MFVPFGYFLASLTRPIRALLIGLGTSLCIELIQFFTYRGMLDVDDLVSNVLGAAAGMLIYHLLGKVEKRRWASWIMLAAGLIGCIMVAVPAAKTSISVNITKQFAFTITSVEADDGKMVLEGECYLFERETPAYTILIDGKEATTTVDGQKFWASTSALGRKAEVLIKFRGFPVMPTGTWIKPSNSGFEVEYVAGEVPVISGVPGTAVLKAWNDEYDVLVYQDGDRILWLVGTEVDQNTEVIYHIHTTEPEKLPDNRVQYGFDNRGFRAGTERRNNELESIDHYRVFEQEIPDGYHVTAIVVGFNTDGTVTWNDSFRIK